MRLVVVGERFVNVDMYVEERKEGTHFFMPSQPGHTSRERLQKKWS